jgi:hypothetical protein
MAYVGESVVGLRVVGVAVFGVSVLGAEVLSMPKVRAVHTSCSDCVSRNNTHRQNRPSGAATPDRSVHVCVTLGCGCARS